MDNINKTAGLSALRTDIDALDLRLLALLNERAKLAQQIAEIKTSSGAGDMENYYRPEREVKVLRRLVAQNTGPLSAHEVTRLFREIMSACLALEQVLNIAYLGPQGTFTHEAALKHFGHSVQTTSYLGIDQVFLEVESGSCHYGVVPIENSIEGVVNHTLDMLANSSLYICGEVTLRVHQHLLGKTDDLHKIQQIYSHQQSFAQCRTWLDRMLPKAEQISVMSNAEAASRVNTETIAAVAGESAAEHYKLQKIASNIEDEPNNTTRFLVLGRQSSDPSGHDKTSLLFSAPNKVGGLQQMLACFSAHDVSMTRLESRPSRQEIWEYFFFVDLLGHIEEANVAAAVDALREQASFVKCLGSYPQTPY